jgi:predicted alpha/beta-hydrolase family hydrolase
LNGKLKKESRLLISESLGSTSIIASMPKEASALLVVGHGAGAGMTHTFMESLADELVKRNIGCIRYNFLYMEKKSRRPDPAPIAEKTVAVLIHHIHQLYPSIPLYVGGKSFGGRMTSQRLSKESLDYVKGLIFFGFPLHPIGQPSSDRAQHLKKINIPMLFLQGTKDKLADLVLLEDVIKILPTATLQKWEGADHSFKLSKQNLIPLLADATADWIKQLNLLH